MFLRGAISSGGGGGGGTVLQLVRHFSKKRAENVRKINPRVPPQEAKIIAQDVYGVIKAHGPLTVSNTWNHLKEAGVGGLDSKTHMKLLLKWMRGRKMLKLFCKQVGNNKKFLHSTLPEEPPSGDSVLEEEFTGKIVTEMKVNLPAHEVWAVFRSHDYAKILLKLSPGYFKAIDYVRGYGGEGTVLNITLQPAFGSSNWLDRIVEINDRTKTRLLRHVKGGILNSGYTRFQSGYTIIKNEPGSCTIRVTTSFDIQQESLSNATLLGPSWFTAITIADYVNSMKPKPLVLNKEFSGEIVTEMKVNLPAKEMWDVYSSKDFGHLLLKLSPGYFKQIDYIKGDGGVGTILNITLQAGDPSQGWLDEIIVLDDKRMTRLLRHIKGGVLNVGYTQFESGYRVLKEPRRSCTVRAFTPFKLTAQAAANPSTLQPNWGTAITIANYVNSIRS